MCNSSIALFIRVSMEQDNSINALTRDFTFVRVDQQTSISFHFTLDKGSEDGILMISKIPSFLDAEVGIRVNNIEKSKKSN